MVQFSNHGGGCCGIGHVYGFGYGAYTLNSVRGMTVTSVNLTEAVLTEEQLTPEVETEMRRKGFVKVSSFHNNNSQHICNVFHRCPTGLTLYTVDGAAVAPPPPPPPPEPQLTWMLFRERLDPATQLLTPEDQPTYNWGNRTARPTPAMIQRAIRESWGARQFRRRMYRVVRGVLPL